MEPSALSDSDLGIHLPAEEYKIMVLLVDDQPMVGEAIRRALSLIHI